MAILKRFETKTITDNETGERKRIKTNRVSGWQVLIDRYDSATGERKRVTVGTYRTKKEAEAAERMALKNRDEGLIVDRSRESVSDLLDRWLSTMKETVTDQTLKGYEIAARVHVKPAIGQAKVQDLKHADVQALVSSWRDDEVTTRGPKTIRAGISVLKQAFDQAKNERLVIVNPVDGVKLPAVKRRKYLKVWSPAEVARFLEVSRDDRLTPLWHLLVLEGMRRSEALGLRWSDLNWLENDRVTAHISQTAIADNTRGGRVLLTERTKTDAGARSVLLTAETVAALKRHKDAQAFTRKKAAGNWIEHDLIVCTSLGTPVDPNHIKRNQARIMNAADVSRLTTHDLRHTAATTMLLAGVPVKMVSEKLGHASVTITMDLYSHVLPNMQQMAADAMDSAVARGREENRKAPMESAL